MTEGELKKQSVTVRDIWGFFTRNMNSWDSRFVSIAFIDEAKKDFFKHANRIEEEQERQGIDGSWSSSDYEDWEEDIMKWFKKWFGDSSST